MKEIKTEKNKEREGRKYLKNTSLETNEVGLTIAIAIAYCFETFQAAAQGGGIQVELEDYVT